jgi:hypothetical protein
MTDEPQDDQLKPADSDAEINAETRDDGPSRKTIASDGLKDNQRNPLAPPTNVNAGS